MLLGVPCVAYRVGGVHNLMEDRTEGLICEPGNVEMLAWSILNLFDMEEKAAQLGENARAHARKTHDPEKNLQDLIRIYEEII